MRADQFLSRILLALSLAVAASGFILCPLILEKDDYGRQDSIRGCTIRDSWQDIALPRPTTSALAFADHRILRYICFAVYAAAGIVLEARTKNKKITGGFHAAGLAACIALTMMLLFACILPYFPLC